MESYEYTNLTPAIPHNNYLEIYVHFPYLLHLKDTMSNDEEVNLELLIAKQYMRLSKLQKRIEKLPEEKHAAIYEFISKMEPNNSNIIDDIIPLGDLDLPTVIGIEDYINFNHKCLICE